MTSEFKRLVAKEKVEYKSRWKKETEGTYVLFYLMIIVYVMISAIWGFKSDSFWGEPPFAYLCIGYIAYIMPNNCIFLIKENGKKVNIFEKYLYVPVDLKRLFMTKLYVISTNIIKIALASQTLALIVRCLEVRQEGGYFFDFALIVPLLAGIFYWLIELFMLRSQYRAVLS